MPESENLKQELAVAVFPLLKTSEPVDIRGYKFLPTDSIKELEPEAKRFVEVTVPLKLVHYAVERIKVGRPARHRCVGLLSTSFPPGRGQPRGRGSRRAESITPGTRLTRGLPTLPRLNLLPVS